MKIEELLNALSGEGEISYSSKSAVKPNQDHAYLPTPKSTPLLGGESSTLSSPHLSEMNEALAIRPKAGDTRPKNYEPFLGDKDVISTCEAGYRDFNVKGVRLIEQSTKRIPYRSDMRSFGTKTGLEALHVYQYKFDYKVRGSTRTFDVLWDYNVGLVRITPFFKALGYSKTTPAKALEKNPGLKDITHSITGGSIFAQGYWMPFDAAKALCTNFCYHIRWPLTPIFGHKFASECLKPKNPQFANFKISNDITVKCTLHMKDVRDGVIAIDDTVDTDTVEQSASDAEVASTRQCSPLPPQTGLKARTKYTPVQAKPIAKRGRLYYEEVSESQPSTSRMSSPEVSPKTAPERSFTPINAAEKRVRTQGSPKRLGSSFLSASEILQGSSGEEVPTPRSARPLKKTKLLPKSPLVDRYISDEEAQEMYEKFSQAEKDAVQGLLKLSQSG
ncbi:MAG: hypothetical protein M1820_002290 [Bogoriella megaspora]|nr:MAG: hypothetical protein M1820_002290 [Bogoriella megaspora]